jgi:hypothetical protein
MRSIFNQRLMCPPERRKQNSPGLQPWERNTPRNRPEKASDLESASSLCRQGKLTTDPEKLRDNTATTPTSSDALSGRFSSARTPRAKALGYSVYPLRARLNCVAVIYFLLPLSGCTRVGSYAPSLDVYGSYFPAWLICLIVGVILTVLASQIGRVLDLSQLRKFGPLVPISLILIFSIATWFLFFAS